MNIKALTIILALIGAISFIYSQNQGIQTPTQFQSWKIKYGVKYESMLEHAYRQKIFLENVAIIEQHNMQEGNTYTLAINQFTDMTDEEFAQIYLGTIVPAEKISEVTDGDYVFSGQIDWVARGAVTEVKNQGKCGSCWAFSATGSLEGLHQLLYGQLKSFSEQQLVDCSGSFGNMDCRGGLMQNAFQYVSDYGIVLQQEYPYQGVLQTCKINKGSFKISGFGQASSCTYLGNAISARPVSVTVDATNWSKYGGGVFDNCKASLNHGVTLVGVKDGNWVIKNSWGASWGENGYIRLAAGNTCGLCNSASYPTR